MYYSESVEADCGNTITRLEAIKLYREQGLSEQDLITDCGNKEVYHTTLLLTKLGY